MYNLISNFESNRYNEIDPPGIACFDHQFL